MGEPLAGLLAGFPLGFQVLLDEGGGQGVGDGGGQARIRGIVENFDQARIANAVDFEVVPHQAKDVVLGKRLGFRQMQSFAPGGKAALLFFRGQLRGEVQVGDDLFQNGLALQNADLGLDVESGLLRGPFIVGGGVHVTHVEEVLIHVLDFQGGSRLVHRRLNEREQHPGQKAQAGDQEQAAFVAPEHVPVFEQQRRGLAVQDHRRRRFEVSRPRRQIARAVLARGWRLPGFVQ